MGFLFWRKRIHQPELFTVKLMHDLGHEILMNNVTAETVKFIKDNLGRDAVCIFTEHHVNLKTFNYASIQNVKDKRDKTET